MQPIRRTAAVMVAAVVMFCYSAAARAQGVLDQVPADALVVIKINRLDQTNQKAGKWTEALGLAQLSPEAADPLGALQSKIGVKEGIDRKGDAAIVFLDPAKVFGAKAAPRANANRANADPDAAGDDAAEEDDGGNGNDGPQNMLILVPTTDYKAFTGGLPNPKTEGNVTTFHTDENEDEPGYVANWGKFAAISPSKALVQNKPQGGLKVSGLAARELKEKDIVIYANLPAIKAKALPAMQKLRQQMKEMQASGGNPFSTKTEVEIDADAEPAAADADADSASEKPPAAPFGTRRNAPRQGDRKAPPARRPGQPGARADDAVQVVPAAAFQPQRQPRQPQRQPRRPVPARRPQPAREPEPTEDAADDAAPDADPDEPSARDDNGQDANQQQMAQAMMAMMDSYFAIAERVLNDGQAATISFTLSDEGLNTTTLAEFTPNSYMGKIAQGLKNSDQGMLAGLPDRKYFAFGGGTISPQAMNQLLTDLIQPMVKQLQAAQANGGAGPADGAKGNPQEFLNATRQILDNSKSVAFGYTVPTGALGAESVVQAVTVVHGNAKAIAQAERKALSNMNFMFQAMPQAGGAMAFEMTEGSKTVGGVKLDQYKFNMAMDENDPRAAQLQQTMNLIYGPNGMAGYMGAVNDNAFLMVQGGTDKLLADSVAAAQKNQDVLSRSAPVQAVRGELPKSRAVEAYIALDQIISSGVKYAQGMGMPMKMQLPQGLPPIGITAGSEGNAVRFDSHVPTSLIQSVVAAGMQAYMQLQGGGAPDGL